MRYLKVGIENVDVVDLETAKHLKKCGFDKPTHWYHKHLHNIGKIEH
jgi:hypothetical protein